jgi:putative ABC transport system ATP-binding protein
MEVGKLENQTSQVGNTIPEDSGSAKPMVQLQNVVRTYRTNGMEVPALRGVDLELPRGVMAALKGRSGSGKTTLLNLIGGLDRPTSGEIIFDERPLSATSDKELTLLRRCRMGFIFQSFALLPTYSAYENVELALRVSGLSRREQIERARWALKVVGLARWMDHRPDEMSGGQQQRVAIARALSTRPDLILADEPTGELDTTTSRQIFSLFHHIVEKEGLTILLTTHDPLVDEYADIIYQLQDGRITSVSQ